jgi:GMP synthase (glutamine-hydrolysing)
MTGAMFERTVCLYLAGAPGAAARERHGTFVDMFDRLFAAHPGVRVRVFDGQSGRLPALDQLDGIVVSGSPASVTAPQLWMEAAVELIRGAHAARTPLLGVCFGHQLIGAAFGAAVIRNPAGWHLAVDPVTVQHSDDPLFHRLPARFDAVFSHQDILDPDTLSPRNGVRVLARAPKTHAAVIAAGPHIRGVQFHPEFTGAINRTYLELRRDELIRESQARDVPADHPDVLLSRSRDAAGEAVFHNFLTYFVKQP